MHTIRQILDVIPFKLILEFDNGEKRIVDLEAKFQEWSRSPDSKFKELLAPGQFATVKLNEEFQSVFWDNGIDLCPDVLYELSKESDLASVSS